MQLFVDVRKVALADVNADLLKKICVQNSAVVQGNVEFIILNYFWELLGTIFCKIHL